MTINVKLWMSNDMKARGREYAWQHRTTLSDVIREVVDDFLEHGLDANLAPVDVPSVQTKAGVKMDETLWERARQRAESHGVSIASVIRRGIEARTAGVRVP